jgi:hypothetical protein
MLRAALIDAEDEGVSSVIILGDMHNTHWAAIASDVVSAVLVAVTATLVWVTTRYVKPTVTLARETIRARVDQQAPRAIVGTEDNPNVYSASQYGEPQPAKAAQPGGTSSLELRVPAHNDQVLLVRTTVSTRNEGVGSGYVGVVQSLTPGSARLPGCIRIRPPDPVLLQPLSLAQIAGVQTVVKFTVEVGMTVAEWLGSEQHTRHIQVRIHDLFADGVDDTIPVTITAGALVMDPNDSGRALVRLEPPGPIATRVGNIQRRYRGEPPAAAT